MDTKLFETCRSLRLRRSTSSVAANFTLNFNNKSFDNLIDYEEESAFCEPVYSLLDFFHQYYIPFIILVGFVGNLLSCIVFLNTHLKMRSSSYYLAALATTDFSFLVSLLFVWLNSQIGWRVFNKDGWCEVIVYVSAVCSSLSVWLIVAFTVERFIAVQYPLQRPYICTVARAKTIILILVILALGCHSYVFVTAGVIKSRDGSEDICDLKLEYLEVMRIINITDTVASLIAPLILIVVMNTMIMRNFLKFSRRFKQAPTMTTVISNQCPSRERSEINLNQIPSGSSGNSGIILGTRRVPSQQSSHSSKHNHSHHSSTGMAVAVQTTATAIGTTAPPVMSSSAQGRNGVFSPPEVVTRCIHIRSSSRNLATTRNQQSITKMLLLISTVFVLLNLPSYAIRLCIFFFALARRDRPALLWCLQQFFMLLYYTNFSINFLLYAMCGITFRRCLDQLLRKCLKNVTRYLGRRRRNSESS
ncbi:thyrotropin-releasing hormone receptor-like [Chelonus insularis]|uniref:thyrotropin-releasing hormone receptor-like n=1 Tax=Chelonus insularis TaxID=460826 RepID=UPI00158934F7|nr:thyrotropin-releasing hormone receptor-like [Chelonus insularis]